MSGCWWFLTTSLNLRKLFQYISCNTCKESDGRVHMSIWLFWELTFWSGSQCWWSCLQGTVWFNWCSEDLNDSISSSGGWTSGEAKQITGEDFVQIDFWPSPGLGRLCAKSGSCIQYQCARVNWVYPLPSNVWPGSYFASWRSPEAWDVTAQERGPELSWLSCSAEEATGGNRATSEREPQAGTENSESLLRHQVPWSAVSCRRPSLVSRPS